MHAKVAALVLGLVMALGAAACGDDSGNSDASGGAATTQASTPRTESRPKTETSTQGQGGHIQGPDRFAGAQRDKYEQAEDLCSAVPPEELAHDVGSPSTGFVDIARAYSKQSDPASRRAAFAGCLAGLM